MVRVAFLGPFGTYSHQAALQQFPSENTTFIPQNTISDCFAQLSSDDSIEYAVVPLENSTNGQVVFTYDLLRDALVESQDSETSLTTSNIEIVAEQYVSIDLCLIAPAEIDLFSSDRPKIGRVYSHPQVWGQAAQYLKKLEEKVGPLDKVDASSTSGALKLCCDSYRNNTEFMDLAIAGRAAAAAHGGIIIDAPINDKKGNTTRFLVLARKSLNRVLLQPLPPVDGEQQKITLIAFTAEPDKPGSLVDVLTVFKEHGLNMCSIASRPFHPQVNNGKTTPTNSQQELQHKWQYIFFVEICDREENDWNSISRYIAELTCSYRIWGTFYRSGGYYK
ncbi:LAMI_0G06876g1_1 [Lachancea mirantina]|uniref:prephenate dehydratase n=1 Tax=Lachancea mirantina TaxID=1230905 RepID=A0A1G4K9G4_9SACH|nr:LAMI_0G06876g1_1 [Lachancea mirantina]